MESANNENQLYFFLKALNLISLNLWCKFIFRKSILPSTTPSGTSRNKESRKRKHVTKQRYPQKQANHWSEQNKNNKVECCCPLHPGQEQEEAVQGSHTGKKTGPKSTWNTELVGLETLPRNMGFQFNHRQALLSWWQRPLGTRGGKADSGGEG